jgi:hypothetical protein
MPAPLALPAGIALQAAPSVGASLLGNPLVQGIGARLLAALGGKALGGIVGSPQDTAFQQQLNQIQALQPDYLNLLRQQAAGQPTAVTRAITEQVRQQGRGQQQALATSAGRLGQGGTAVARAQQARQLAAENQALTQLLGQAQQQAQQQIGALTGQATQQQALLAQQEAQDISELAGFITSGIFDQEIKDKLQMLVDAVQDLGVAENVAGEVVAQAPGISPVRPPLNIRDEVLPPAPPLGTVTGVERATVTPTTGGQLASPSVVPQVRTQAAVPTVPGTQPVPGLRNVPRPQAPVVQQQPTPRTATQSGNLPSNIGSVSPKVSREQVKPTTSLPPTAPADTSVQNQLLQNVRQVVLMFESGIIDEQDFNWRLFTALPDTMGVTREQVMSAFNMIRGQQ